MKKLYKILICVGAALAVLTAIALLVRKYFTYTEDDEIDEFDAETCDGSCENCTEASTCAEAAKEEEAKDAE